MSVRNTTSAAASCRAELRGEITGPRIEMGLERGDDPASRIRRPRRVEGGVNLGRVVRVVVDDCHSRASPSRWNRRSTR